MDELMLTNKDSIVVTPETCRRCGQEFSTEYHDENRADGVSLRARANSNRTICVECDRAERSRVTYYRQLNDGWMEAAAEQNIALWLQQPNETQWEYTVWSAYRDSYPGRKPSYRVVAEQLATSTAAVAKIAQRWSFNLRMIAWIEECDRVTMAQRHQEILDMNKVHVDMATKLNQKLQTAINNIEPHDLKPAEIVQLTRLATEIERKARLDTLAQEEAQRQLASDVENPALKQHVAKKDDMSEIVDILLKAGALGDITATTIGVRKTSTETTELVVKGEE